MIPQARLEFSSALSPTPAPMMTMAAFTKSSGLIDSFRSPANLGKKLPITNPARSASTKPASPVSFSDQPMPNLLNSAGVVAAMRAWLPKTQHAKLMANASVKETMNFLRGHKPGASQVQARRKPGTCVIHA